MVIRVARGSSARQYPRDAPEFAASIPRRVAGCPENRAGWKSAA
jgi:hypothetical protein